MGLPAHFAERLVQIRIGTPRLAHGQLFGDRSGGQAGSQCQQGPHAPSPTYTRGTRGPSRVTIS